MLIVEEPYLISALLAVFLNITLPVELDDQPESGEGAEWNTPLAPLASQPAAAEKAV